MKTLTLEMIINKNKNLFNIIVKNTKCIECFIVLYYILKFRLIKISMALLFIYCL